jgi:hypothetical protein
MRGIAAKFRPEEGAMNGVLEAKLSHFTNVQYAAQPN